MTVDTIQLGHPGSLDCTVEEHQVIREAVVKRDEQINVRFGAFLGKTATIAEVLALLPRDFNQPTSAIGKGCVELELKNFYTHA